MSGTVEYNLSELLRVLKNVVMHFEALNIKRLDYMERLLKDARKAWLESKSCDVCQHRGERVELNGMSRRDTLPAEFCRVEQKVAFNDCRTCDLHFLRIEVGVMKK